MANSTALDSSLDRSIDRRSRLPARVRPSIVTLGLPDVPQSCRCWLRFWPGQCAALPPPPITTYLAGYAAGVAAAGGADAEAAARDALDRVRRLASP